MKHHLFINGRFLVQPLSGVQRFAIEITSALRRIHKGPMTILVPPGASTQDRAVRVVGQRSGHAWEQLDLPRHVGDGILLNLGNTGPVLVRRQVLVVHDAGVFSTPEAYSWKFRVSYKLIQHCLMRTTMQIVTVSEFSRADLASRFGIAADRIAAISEGADHVHAIAAEPEILAAHGLVHRQYVLVVGNLAAHKNLAALGELARRLHQRNTPLVVIGGIAPAVFQGDGQSRLPQPAHYLGRVSDGELKALYEAAACFVVPSLYEGFGLPAVEAMACSCPVVAADIPGLRETCGDAVLYCDPHSPEDIAVRVGCIMEDPELSERLRCAGRIRAAQLTWDRAGRALDRVLEATAAAVYDETVSPDIASGEL